VAFIVRAFQYAWPPLAYSVTDDAQAARFYGLVTTAYVLVSGWVVAGLALLGRWVLLVLTSRPAYLGAYRALPWVALGWAMYGLWVVFLVVAGRVGVTRRNFPAAAVGLVVNVGLIVTLVRPLGIAGAGIALVGAYAAMLVVMHLLTRTAFRVEFEWGRLARVVLVVGGIAAAGAVGLPDHGASGFALRLAAFAAIPVLLLAGGFLHPEERAALRAVMTAIRRRLRATS
jgi:O-antigen/teichoic acid export membrane protein